MKKILIIFIGFFITINIEAGQNLNIWGRVVNSITQEGLVGAHVYLMTLDSILLDSTTSRPNNSGNRNLSIYSFSVKDRSNYIVCLKYKGFETKYVNVNWKGLPKRQNSNYLGNNTLKQRIKTHVLNGVVVKATRIKMFHKGDTIIYDADAFNLAKGSMLDALIAEMPGVQLKDDGRIYVNGRFVDELLLNGKDFFRGDKNVLLENMPAYMVKWLKVYERKKNQSRIGEKYLVMDVELKKEYQIGWIANAELAGGTENHYLTRLFGLRFTKNSRLTLFGNINNINDKRKPGRMGDWVPESMDKGLQTIKKAGADFRLDADYYTLSMSNTVEDIHVNQKELQSSNIFLPSNNIFGLIRNYFRSHYSLWRTSNQYQMALTHKLQLLLLCNLSYQTSSNNGLHREISLNKNPDIWQLKAPLDSLCSSELSTNWYSSILNRNANELYQDNYHITTNGSVCFTYKPFEGLFDSFAFEPFFYYEKQNTTLYKRNHIEYLSDKSKLADSLHNYVRTPEKNYNFGGELRYYYASGKIIGLNPSIRYTHSYDSSDRDLFNLNKFEGWKSHTLTDLPSTYDSLQMVMDGRNSYYSRTKKDNAYFELRIEGGKSIKNFQINFEAKLPIDYTYTHLNYLRNNNRSILTRHTIFFDPYLMFDLRPKKGSQRLYVTYNAQTVAPSLAYKINILDDVDPLNVILSNANLRNEVSHRIWCFYELHTNKHLQNMIINLYSNFIRNSLAMGFVYDTKTGIRTTQPANVNGNWNISGQTDYNRSLGKKDLLTLDTHTNYGYLHNVDLTGTTDGMGVERSVVNTWNMGEEASLKYKIGHNSLGVKGKVAWSDITSGRANFENMNVWDFQYGVTALWNLPLKLQLSTDLTMFSRRGYELSSMNTNDLVWNARLSRTFLNGNMTCFVDGFDILGNLSNIYRSVNAQGRTETRYNVVPRYVMFHLIYRLNIQPKKKK